MSRYRGTFTVAANYEPLKAAPFDARSIVGTKADLTDPQIWQQENGDVWVYVGMLVTVIQDVKADDNGTYRLNALPYTDPDNWVKQADEDDIERLQAQIENIEVGAGSLDITVSSEVDLPVPGDKNATYYVKTNSSIYRWDEETQTYQSYGGTGEIPELNIQIIHGGNAHGTN